MIAKKRAKAKKLTKSESGFEESEEEARLEADCGRGKKLLHFTIAHQMDIGLRKSIPVCADVLVAFFFLQPSNFKMIFFPRLKK